MEYVSRDTCQDRFVNFTTDNDRAPIINNYLTNKIKVTPFCNTIGRTAKAGAKSKTYVTNLAKLAKWLSVHLQTKWFWVQVQL